MFPINSLFWGLYCTREELIHRGAGILACQQAGNVATLPLSAPDHPYRAMEEANARLIAAAPEMLSRLKDLCADLKGAKELMLLGAESDSWMVTEDGWNSLLDKTKRIIAKAEGTM